MTRKRVRRFALICIPLLLLAIAGFALMSYQQSHAEDLAVGLKPGEVLPAPQYLYAFSGKGADRLARPLGVLAESDRVLVTDSKRSVVDVFSAEGNRTGIWGKGHLVVPLYIARHPKTGEYYVSDRRLRAIVILGPNGEYRRLFDPRLPKGELPKVDTKGAEWAPVALDFAPDGSLYVTEILNGHRLLIFDSQGKFVKSVGTAGLVADAEQGGGSFQFPNSVKVTGQEVWVADSNNRRLQIFDRAGKFKRLIVTQGLPRGFDFLPKSATSPLRLVVVDTLAHDATIWDAARGEKIATFGTGGSSEGQFSYPNDTSVDARGRIFIADTANGRVQVWGWPARTAIVPGLETPLGWLLRLLPLLLLPLLLLLRRRRAFATSDFVLALHEMGEFDRLPQRRTRWEMLPEDYEGVLGLEQSGVRAQDFLEQVESSDSDARAIQERYELEWDQAVVLAGAQRTKLFGTQDAELRRAARGMDLNVVNADEYVRRTSKRRARGTTDTNEKL